MSYRIKKLQKKHIKKEYIETINHSQTKKFIQFAKIGKSRKTKKDLDEYLDKLPKNAHLFGVFKKNIHVANFKFQPIEKKVFIGFLMLKKYQGKGIFRIIFSKIIKKFKLKYPKEKKLYLGVNKKNYRAIRLYNKLGFKLISQKKSIMTLNV